MAIRRMIPQSALAFTAACSLALEARGQDLGTYQQAMGYLARSSGIRSPAFLVGIGQFYCFMKVGIGEPVQPGEVLAVGSIPTRSRPPRGPAGRNARR